MSARARRLAVIIAVVVVALVAGALVWGLSTSEDPASESQSSPRIAAGYLLQRADPAVGGTDAIVRFDIEDGQTREVFATERIIDFVLAGEQLVVVTERVEAHDLVLVDPVTGDAVNVSLPGTGTVDSLEASGSRVGLRFTSEGDAGERAFVNTLAWFEAGADAVTIVEHADDPFEATDWAWLPGGLEMLAIDSHGDLLRFDPADSDNAEDFGHWETIESVAGDASAAIVRDHHDTVLLSLHDGEAAPFGPTPFDGRPLFGGDVAFLGAGPERVQKVGAQDADTGAVRSHVVLDDGESPRALLSAADGEGVDGFMVSPDGRHVAIEVVPDVAGMVSDAYYPHARAVSIVTRIVSMVDGEVVAEFPGFRPRWASGP